MQVAELKLAIDLSAEKFQEFCAVLNQFALPRAIVDYERHSFVAWNSKFLERTGFSEDEMKSSRLDELLTFGESWFSLSEEKGQTVEYVACAARRPFGTDPAPGFAVRSHGKIGYLMLDAFDSPAAQFEKGRSAGREEERNRVIRTFHEEVSSSIIAAPFLIETVKSELEDAGLPQAEALSMASYILAETTEKIADVIGEADRKSEQLVSSKPPLICRAQSGSSLLTWLE
jgi:PAS domain-containing protein